MQNLKVLIHSLARLESTTVLNPGETPPESAIALVGELKLLIPLAGLIDKDAELSRLDREISKLEKEIGRLSGKLSNEKFTARAPADVVAKEQQKLQETEISCNQLKEQKTKIQAM